ncbi:MAG: CoA pyrophosphatase [Bacteroidota bacterium]|nr:CoA pyrophosphatase [Candidatus Kapabacteria bacterium]MDW8219919.1 CoA pyrophosphatase [Bacteroidota bacterium]
MLVLPPFITFLQKRLQEPLPGYEGQKRMAPFAKAVYEPPHDITTYKQSAVLALLFNTQASTDTPEHLQLLFTVRSNNLKHHSGQISFPGGRSNRGEAIVQTALRETYEEVGISPEHITILGELSPLYVPVSRSMIYVVSGFHYGIPQTYRNTEEVAEIFSLSLSFLMDPKNLGRKPWTVLGQNVEVPFWDIGKHIPLWGATAMITAEILTLYEEFTASYTMCT